MKRCLFSCLVVSFFLLNSSLYAADYTLVGWNDLGMHCMDGSDYSLFSVLPPYNTIYAQLVYRGELVTNPVGITVTYEAITDPDGSINRSSKDKINFWQYVGALFGVTPAPDVGLAGFAMPGTANIPQAMHFDSDHFIAEGIPISVFDDALKKQYYPLMRLTARQGNTVLATTDIVLPVSDEMDCRACHGSGTGDPAKPAAGWAWNCIQEKDVKLNIMQLHDEKNLGSAEYTNLLAIAGYSQNGLLYTATNGTPILCARCHKSNALPGTGLPGVPDFTHAQHSRHATVIDPETGLSLDDANNRTACYRCHPGSKTLCLRGAMGRAIAPDGAMAIQCQNCHGTVSMVGDSSREGWLEEPLCQSCHTGPATHNNGQIRYKSVFVVSNIVRQAVDVRFASNTDTPAPGLSLYRFSRGHSDVFCEACHNSTHAEYPTMQRNDNIQTIQLQGHEGLIGECTVCHVAMPSTVSGGPHGMHPLGQVWVDGHRSPGETEANCAPCHGTDYRGTVLSRMFNSRTLTIEDWGNLNAWRGRQISCYTCHNGPNSENQTTYTPPVATDAATITTAGVPVLITLQGSDPNGRSFGMRVVSQPSHGTAGINGTRATYFPSATFVGNDSFTFAASNGWNDSNLATASIAVREGICSMTLTAIVPPTGETTIPVPFWSQATVSGCSNEPSYSWVYGDGHSTTSIQNACHVFSMPGLYDWLVVSRAGGTVVTQTGQIDIMVIPEPVGTLFLLLAYAVGGRKLSQQS